MVLFEQGINKYDELVRAAFAPIEELGRYMNLAVQSNEEFRRMQDLVQAAEKQFHLPEITNAMNLLGQFENSTIANVMKRYQVQMSELQRSFEAMSTPWIDTTNELRSMNGFVALQGIGHVLNTMQPFDRRLTDALRIDLGDWRKEITWPPDVFVDPLARTSFYKELGLNPALTAFPASTFKQIIVNTGLERPQEPIADGYYIAAEREEVEGEIAFERNNDAYNLIQRFETRMRKFINEQMRAAYGTTWVKHQVPGEMRKKWIDKQQKYHASGNRELPLIAYADFTDYVVIITRRDNWQKVFETVFAHKDFIQESFRRLFPIRICTMHSRPITQDDELYLLAETKRILKAIRAKI